MSTESDKTDQEISEGVTEEIRGYFPTLNKDGFHHRVRPHILLAIQRSNTARDERIEALEKELAEAQREVRFWAGEGRERRPDMIEWQKLVDKKNPTEADRKRIGEICRAVEDEDMDAPERLAEIIQLRKQVASFVAACKEKDRAFELLKVARHNDAETVRVCNEALALQPSSSDVVMDEKTKTLGEPGGV